MKKVIFDFNDVKILFIILSYRSYLLMKEIYYRLPTKILSVQEDILGEQFMQLNKKNNKKVANF